MQAGAPNARDAERAARALERLADDAAQVRRRGEQRTGVAADMHAELTRIGTRAGGLLAASISKKADAAVEHARRRMPAEQYWRRMVLKTWDDLRPTFRPRARAEELLTEWETRFAVPWAAYALASSSHDRDDALDVLFLSEVAEIYEACARAAADCVRSRQERPKNKVPGLPRHEANIRAHELLRDNPSITAAELARAIPCAQGTVPKLPAWRVVQERKRRGPRRTAAGAVPLSGAVLDSIAQQRAKSGTDNPLTRLIAEQEADAEPSSVVPDPPDGKPRRVRAHKRA